MRITETLDYYDGPQVALCADFQNQYLAVRLHETDEADFILTRITPHLLRRLRDGKVDLRTAMLRAKWWMLGNFSEEESELSVSAVAWGPIDGKRLPWPDFYLNPKYATP